MQSSNTRHYFRNSSTASAQDLLLLVISIFYPALNLRLNSFADGHGVVFNALCELLSNMITGKADTPRTMLERVRCLSNYENCLADARGRSTWYFRLLTVD